MPGDSFVLTENGPQVGAINLFSLNQLLVPFWNLGFFFTCIMDTILNSYMSILRRIAKSCFNHLMDKKGFEGYLKGWSEEFVSGGKISGIKYNLCHLLTLLHLISFFLCLNSITASSVDKG